MGKGKLSTVLYLLIFVICQLTSKSVRVGR